MKRLACCEIPCRQNSRKCKLDAVTIEKKKTNQVTGGLETADEVERLYCKEGAFGAHEQAQALGCGDGRI